MKTAVNVFGWALMYFGAALCVPGLVLLAFGDWIEAHSK